MACLRSETRSDYLMVNRKGSLTEMRSVCPRLGSPMGLRWVYPQTATRLGKHLVCLRLDFR